MKSVRKMLLLVLSFLMIFACCPLASASQAENIVELEEIQTETTDVQSENLLSLLSESPSVPQIKRAIYDDFSRGLDARIVKETGTGELSVSDGKLVIKRPNDAYVNVPDETRIYLNASKTADTTAQVTTEFVINRDVLKLLDIGFFDEENTKVTAIKLLKSGEIAYSYKETAEADAAFKILGENTDANEDVKITVEINHISGTVSVWIDEEAVIYQEFCANASDNLSYVSFLMRASSYQTVLLDSFKVYESEASNADRINMDYALLTFDKLSTESATEVTSDLNIPLKGENGSTITWSAVDNGTGAITSDGKIIRPQDADAEVKLIAQISYGGESVSKTFDITVKKVSDSVKPSVKTLIAEDSMTNSKFSSLYGPEAGSPKATENGIKVIAGDAFDYYHDSLRTDYFAPLAYEFTLAGDGTIINLCDSKGTICFSIKQEKDGVYALIRPSYDETADWVMIKGGYLKESRFVILADPKSGMFSVWNNGDKLVDAKLGADIVSRLYRFNVVQTGELSYIRDFKAYVANVPSEDAAKFDFEAIKLSSITWQDADKITDNLKLPTVGNAGSTISWLSSNEEVINPLDGTVTMPEEGYVDVTLTVTVTNGGATYTKDINLKVIAAVKDEKPEVKKMLSTDDFDENVVDGHWSFGQTNGKIVTKDEKIIFKRLTYSEENTGVTEMNAYFDEATSYFSGVYCMEFTMRRIGTPYTLYLRAKGKGGDYFAANWLNTGDLRVYQGENTTLISGVGESAKVTILFNTIDSTYSLWINDVLKLYNQPSREKNSNIRNMRFYAGVADKTHVEIDNMRIYEAYSLSVDRVPLDYDDLVVNKLVDPDDEAFPFGYISKKLTLPTDGKYGSKINWSFEPENIVLPDGTLNKGEDYQTVKLTAAITSGETRMDKEFTFTVIPEVSEGMSAAEKDMAMITYDTLACDEGGSQEIKRALNLRGRGAFGSEITWSTSNAKYISASGRVTRPYDSEENVPVTITATVKNGDAVLTKDFTFTVLADEKFTDPLSMSDEEFFGVWDGDSWQTEPKWNYSFNEGMENLGEVVKEIGVSGDYTKAKEELLNYFKGRKSNSSLSKGDRNTGWANMAADGFYHLQQSKYYNGTGYVKSDWDTCYIDIKRPSELEPGKNMAYSVRSWYNESTMAEIMRHTAEDSSMRPRLELTVNGDKKIIEASDSVEVRAGSFADTNYGNEEVMKVQTFGDFLSDNTRYAKIKFNLSELKETDVVTKARLILHARTPDNSEKEKRLILIFEPSSTWSSEDVTWNGFTGYVYNFNGLPDRITWSRLPNADNEVYGQGPRFYPFPAIAVEYQLTGDDSYAYRAQKIIEDFLVDTGDYKSSGTKYSEDPNGTRGGFPNTLGAALRMNSWRKILDIMMKNPHATPDFATAFFKSMWYSYNYLTEHRTETGNWRQFELESLLGGSIEMQEFTDSTAGKNWKQDASSNLEELIFRNNVEDGSYVEACNDYSIGAFNNFVSYKTQVIEMGGNVSPEYDELLHKSAYYQAMLYSSDGVGLAYGDGGDSKRPADSFQKVADWYNDDVLEYIITYGKKGTEPDWTSIHFPLSTVTAMHANWSTSAPYLFIHTRGGGNHGHADDNGIILSAYNRRLLVDAGKFTYDSTDPYRQYAASTKAHNTVLINERTQRHQTNQTTGIVNYTHAEYNEVYDFTTNSAFDFLSQSSRSVAGFDHRRSITFLKPNIWIVSDRIIPTNKDGTNNYKQLWHMLPTAQLASSEDNRTIYSNFETGANIILASADSEVQVKEALGWIDDGYQVAQPSTYGYFEKANIKGTATLDTVIAVNNEDKTAALTSDKLETEGDATAVKFNLTANGEDFVGYYRMSYDQSVGSFGDYETDAGLAYVQEKADGTIVSILIKDGSYIKKADGTVIFESEEKVGEVYVDMTGTNTYVTTDSETDSSKFTIFSANEPLSLYVNDEAEPFAYEDGYILNIGSTTSGSQTTGKIPSAGISQNKKDEEDKEEVNTEKDDKEENPKEENEKEDNDKEDDDDKGSGGGSGGGGGSSGGSGGGSGAIGGGMSGGTGNVLFSDTQGHWAREYILDLKAKNIVNGDENGNFNPNNKITRAEFVAIVTRALGLGNPDYDGTFTDVAAESWYAKAVQAALSGGLISKDANFRPNDPITRQEMAKIIAEAAKLPEKYANSESQYEKYTDKDSISDWAKSYVSMMSVSGLMSGRDDGGFYPHDNATRAEAAAVISRMIKN